MNASPTFSDFSVHVFVDHDPFIASVLLPDLFSEFSDSVWRLPQEIATPPRPEVPPNPIPPYLFRELWASPRKGLGRHIFPDVVPSSTTLRELSESIEQEFSLNRRLVATFTIFPQEHLEDGTLPKWHDQPLPWDITLGEVALLDEDAVATGQYAGIADQYAPVLHLVIETKAAALNRCLGGIVDEKFLARALGEEYKHRRDIWSRLQSFIDAFPPTSFPEIVNALRRWRSTFYSLRYLENERDKLIIQEPVDQNVLRTVASNIKKFQSQKSGAKLSCSALASQWENWVLKQNYGHDGHIGNEELKDDQVDEKVRFVLRQRTLVVEWGKSEKKESLGEILRESYGHGGKNTRTNEQKQDNPMRPGSSNARIDKSEERWEMVSKEEVTEQPCNQAFPDTCAVKTLPFRRADGTLDPEFAKFTVKSGILSWGQVLPIYYGSLQEKLTNNANRPLEVLPGGTIMQHVYTYKSAARVGDWKVRRYYSNLKAGDPLDPDAEKFQAGWVVCHDDIDPLDIVQRVGAIGTRYGPGAVSNGNEHTNKDVLYIGRYDWSYHWHNPKDPDFEEKFRDWAKSVLETDDDKEIRPFPEEVEGLTQEQRIEEKQKIVLALHHKLDQGLLNPKRPAKEDDIPALAEHISLLEKLLDSETRIFRNAYMHNILHAISKLKSIPREDEFGIKKRAGTLLDKWMKLLKVDPACSPWYYVVPSIGISGVRQGGYFIAMDAENFDLDFVKAYKCYCEVEDKKVREVVFSKGEERFGTYVGFPPLGGDEFAWLVFSGKKHQKFDADELIAIVYDGTYEVFQGLYHAVEAEADPREA